MSRQRRASLEFLGRAGPHVLSLLPRGPSLPFWGNRSGLCSPGEVPGSAGGFRPRCIFNRLLTPIGQPLPGPEGAAANRPAVSGATSSYHGVTYLNRAVPGAASAWGGCSDFVFEPLPIFEACLSKQGALQSQARETKEEAEDASPISLLNPGALVHTAGGARAQG